ncbi:MAG: CpaF family protein [Clostridiaceae bacterium]|nr:CpaF family protein [Clostridiaceae bacterium]
MSLIQSPELLVQTIASCGVSSDSSFCMFSDRSDQQKEGDSLTDLISKVCIRILDEHPELAASADEGNDRAALKDLIVKYAEELSIRAGLYRNQLQQQVLDSLFGYGPLQYLIDDPDISDIDAVSPTEITVKKFGVRMRVSTAFESSSAYETFCRLLIIRQGGLINENDSHCRVTDSKRRLRINVTVPPRSVEHSSLSIRKHPSVSLSLEDLAAAGMFEPSDTTLLSDIAGSQCSFLICGKGGSGKTTLLRAMINAMPPLERVLIAESDSEIYADKPCCMSQRIRRVNEGGRPVSLRDLVSDGLTMSLDTYCIGEIVGDEAYEFMRAAYSGHRCLATIHAISAEDALDRLISLARTVSAGEQDYSLKQMLARSVNMIIYLNSFKVQKIVKVNGYNKEKDSYAFEIIREKENEETSDYTYLGTESLVPS